MISQVVLCLCGILVSSVCLAQEFISISGEIVDAATKKPLPFSTVNIKDRPIGIVANSEGDFYFSFEDKFLEDTILISRAGYELLSLRVSSLINQPFQKFELTSKAILMEEIVITDKAITAEEIIALVKANIKKNYPTKPFEFEAFYRDYKIEDEKCVGLFEAAVSVYDKGYTGRTSYHTLKEKVTLRQVRKSLSATYKSHVFREMNIMTGLLGLNDMRYVSRAMDKKKKFDYSMDGFSVINDRIMYKLRAVDDWVFTLYVDIQTYAVPKIEMNFEWQDGVAENEWTKYDSIRYQQRKAVETLEFQTIDGLMYPKYHSFTSQLHAFDATTGDALFTSVLQQEYMVTDINTHAADRPDKNELMDPDVMLEQQVANYDQEFWKNYNVLRLNSQDQQLVKDLERDISLSEQYEQSVVKEKKKRKKR